MSTNITKKLAGKAALVTGGSRSIGAAIAKRLAADGAAAALTYSASPDKADEVVRSIEAAGGKALAIKADAADTEAVRLAVAKTGFEAIPHGMISNDAILSPSSLKKKRRSTGLPGKFPTRWLVTTVLPSFSSHAKGSHVY